MSRRQQQRSCSVTGCGRPHQCKGLCNTHYQRWRRTGEVGEDTPMRPAAPNASGYWAANHQVTVLGGPAAEHRCAECGQAAACWSYDGTDPDERTHPTRGHRYSLDVERYRPRCRSCHARSVAGAGALVLDGERAARLYDAGASARGIAALLGVSPSSVVRALRARGVQLRHPGPPRRSSRPRRRADQTPPITEAQLIKKPHQSSTQQHSTHHQLIQQTRSNQHDQKQEQQEQKQEQQDDTKTQN